jgi:hypothetical protein
MRCVFQYALPEGGQIAEGLLDQTFELAQGALQVKNTPLSRNIGS